MASISVAPIRRSPQPGKQQLYQQQVFINRALAHVVIGCQEIQSLHIIPRSFTELYANMAQELCALINSRIAEEMRPIEDVDAQHFQQERLKWESRPRPVVESKTRVAGKRRRR